MTPSEIRDLIDSGALFVANQSRIGRPVRWSVVTRHLRS